MKLLIISLFFSSVLFGLEVNIVKNDIVKKATAKEVDMLKFSYMQRHIKIEDDSAAKLINENRILAQEYINKNLLDDNMKINIKLEIEKVIAERYIKLIQRDIKIDDATLKSYYIANKKEFSKPKDIKIDICTFKEFDAALKFYNKFKNTKNEHTIKEYILDKNISVIPYEGSIKRLSVQMQDMINSKSEELPFLLIPQFYIDHYSVGYVKEVKKEGFYSFTKVKEKIRNILYNLTFKRERNKIIKKVENKDD